MKPAKQTPTESLTAPGKCYGSAWWRLAAELALAGVDPLSVRGESVAAYIDANEELASLSDRFISEEHAYGKWRQKAARSADVGQSELPLLYRIDDAQPPRREIAYLGRLRAIAERAVACEARVHALRASMGLAPEPVKKQPAQ